MAANAAEMLAGDPLSCAAADADVRPQLLNPAVAEQLRTGRKTATIRLGDKSAKYRKGMIVTVLLCGARYGQRERIFDAVDRQGGGQGARRALTAGDRARQPADPPRGRDALVPSQLYNREVAEDEIVTLIRFSQIT